MKFLKVYLEILENNFFLLNLKNFEEFLEKYFEEFTWKLFKKFFNLQNKNIFLDEIPWKIFKKNSNLKKQETLENFS